MIDYVLQRRVGLLLVFLRRIRVVLTVVGAVMTVVGVLGLVLGWGSTSAKASNATNASRSSTINPTTPQNEDANMFFDAFEKAVRTGDRTFLFDRMHPAVIQRYGRAQCQAFTESLVDPTVDLHIVSVTGPTNFDYTSDGRTTTVENTFVFNVDGTGAGRTGPRQFHFALVSGQFRSFSDCGDPQG